MNLTHNQRKTQKSFCHDSIYIKFKHSLNESVCPGSWRVDSNWRGHKRDGVERVGARGEDNLFFDLLVKQGV